MLILLIGLIYLRSYKWYQSPNNDLGVLGVCLVRILQDIYTKVSQSKFRNQKFRNQKFRNPEVSQSRVSKSLKIFEINSKVSKTHLSLEIFDDQTSNGHNFWTVTPFSTNLLSKRPWDREEGHIEWLIIQAKFRGLKTLRKEVIEVLRFQIKIFTIKTCINLH